MSLPIYTKLQWLPQPPSDFNSRCRCLLEQEGQLGRTIRALATFALDENQLVRLAQTMAKGRKADRSFAPLSGFRLGILSNATTDFLAPAITASAARHGMLVDCVCAPYGQVLQEALAADSTLNRAQPDAVLLALDYRAFPFPPFDADQASAARSVDAAVGEVEAICRGIREHSGATCIVQTIAPPPETLFGSFDSALPGTLRRRIAKLNSRLYELALQSERVLFDVCGLAETVGLAAWHAPTEWNLAKLAFSSTYVPLYADHVGRLIGAFRGKSRRCLVLDLDNTLWGGVIGDDGLEGIQCCQGDATGEAFLTVQRLALALRDRGIVLAVSSKNDDATARRPFQQHPEMLLNEKHIAVFQANWNDKATNIRAIADELALGTDSMVLLDDNPVERGLVREWLPEVAVPELPSDPALYARTLAAAGYFESVRFSSEDSQRADFYTDNARRATLQKKVGDLDSYLASLDMEITFQPFDETGRSRICQLINKSNQFNLTTRRYTETEVGRLQENGRAFTLQIRLKDAFGDNGMISVIICLENQPRIWDIDTWLMSCRVLGRQVEQIVLQEIFYHARLQGITKVVGRYIPTERNRLVEGHYEKLGFRPVSRQPDGVTVWEHSTAETVLPEIAVRIKRFGFESEPVAV